MISIKTIPVSPRYLYRIIHIQENLKATRNLVYYTFQFLKFCLHEAWFYQNVLFCGEELEISKPQSDFYSLEAMWGLISTRLIVVTNISLWNFHIWDHWQSLVCVSLCVHLLMKKFFLVTIVKKSHVWQLLFFTPEKYMYCFLFEKDLTVLKQCFCMTA